MPEVIVENKVGDFDSYLGTENEVLREALKTLYDNCRNLETRVEELENRVTQLEVDS